MPKEISNDQLFDFMTKMYGELSGRLDSMDNRLDSMDNKMEKEFKELKHDIVRLENKMDTNHKALYDGYKQLIRS